MTPTLLPHSPDYLSTTCLPYPYKPEATCPRWLAFLERNLEADPLRIAVLQEWFGYCLTPDTSYQKFTMLEGNGANGKSVVCACLIGLLGRDNVSSVGLDRFGERFALADTIGKLANIVPEVGDLDRVAEGMLKAVTSGDAIQVERKFKPVTMAVPTAKFLFCTNNRPRFSDRSSGLWRRMILMPFDVTIMKSERVTGMDSADYWADEMPGVLNWALAGLSRLRQRGGFTESPVCAAAVASYRTDCNPAGQFLVDHYREHPEGNVPVSDVYKRYSGWCASHGYRPLGSASFGHEVARCFPSVGKERPRIDGERIQVYGGLAEGSDDDLF